MEEAAERRLLRKKDVVDALGGAKSTVADWITDFRVFIPTIQDGAVTLYPPEALAVLRAIQEMRAQHLSKTDIYRRLQQQGHPVTVEAVIDAVPPVVDPGQASQSLLTLLTQVGQVLNRVADNDATIGHLSEGHTALAARQDGQDERVTDLERTVQALTAELAAVRAALEKRRRVWWQFWR